MEKHTNTKEKIEVLIFAKNKKKLLTDRGKKDKI